MSASETRFFLTPDTLRLLLWEHIFRVKNGLGRLVIILKGSTIVLTHAIARKPGKNFNQGLTTSLLGQPDYSLIKRQHAAYVHVLESLGIHVILLEPQDNYPDAYFVEDTAVVTPNVAVITRSGAVSRQGEEKTIAPLLASYRTIEIIHPPGTVDGGDVLMVGNRFFVGVSERTNESGAEQLGRILKQYGHDWHPIRVGDGLHLKSSLNLVGKDTLLLTRSFHDLDVLKDYDQIVLAEKDGYAANTLFINNHLIMPKGFPEVREKLETLQYPIVELDVSEVRKMDGGLTCLSIRF
jgi:dimethylargininase